MLSSIPVLFALITLALTSAIPGVDKEAIAITVPKLEGFFTGRHNDDGTTTHVFPHLNQTITFKTKSPPSTSLDTSTGLNKRAPYGRTSCWGGNNLDRPGVDQAINNFRDLFRSNPKDLGYLGVYWGIQYFGYNVNGVYVYFCANTKDQNYRDSFDLADLEHALYWMDQDCGPYRPGFYIWDSPSLWGKCLSGTPICLA